MLDFNVRHEEGAKGFNEINKLCYEIAMWLNVGDRLAFQSKQADFCTYCINPYWGYLDKLFREIIIGKYTGEIAKKGKLILATKRKEAYMNASRGLKRLIEIFKEYATSRKKAINIKTYEAFIELLLLNGLPAKIANKILRPDIVKSRVDSINENGISAASIL